MRGGAGVVLADQPTRHRVMLLAEDGPAAVFGLLAMLLLANVWLGRRG